MKLKRTISLIMILCLAFSVCACTTKGAESKEKPGTVISESDDSITVVDQAGREVTAPKDIDSIALCYRVVLRFLLNLDQGDKIKGIGKTEEFMYTLEPKLKNCVSVGQGVADMEALAELNPDLFFHKASDSKTLDAVEKLGIPAVGISIETPVDMKEAIDVMGKICGAEVKANELITYYDNKLREFKKLTSSLNDNDKKTAIMMGSSLGEVADGTMLQSLMIEYAGGVNPAKDIEATELWPTAGIEQIFSWDPDYIFITNSESATYTAEDILNKPEWQQLTAVKNRDVYVMPAAQDSWEFPGIVSVLGMEYIMKTMYPKLISDEKLNEDVHALYRLSYNKEFSKEELGY